MKIGRLVNGKVLITFICSMFSLLTLSTILSHLEIEKKDKSLSASVNEVAKENKKQKKVKVDAVGTYSKNEALTIAPITPEVSPDEIAEEPKQEQTQASTQNTATTQVATPAPAQVAVTGSKAEYQAYARSQFDRYGWNDADFDGLVNLWNRESGWNPSSHSGSGAHGIPQALPASKMAAYGEDYLTNYVTQINWGLDYISAKYGSPSNAWAHFVSSGWY